MIIVDIDDPKNSSFKSKLWNKYYTYLLGDQGDSFLKFNDFNRIADHPDIACKTKTGIIDTIKGKYFYGILED